MTDHPPKSQDADPTTSRLVLNRKEAAEALHLSNLISIPVTKFPNQKSQISLKNTSNQWRWKL